MSFDRTSKTKTTIYLREGDMDVLREHFPEGGASIVVRRLVSRLVDQLRKGEVPEISGLEIDI